MKKDPWFRNHFIRDSIYRAIYYKMKVDSSIYLMGEGSHMKVRFDAPYIEKEFPNRIITLPISEDANTNFALGMSLAGVKPIVDVISSDFLFRTMDGICNTVAKENFIAEEKKTVIIRSEFLTGAPTAGQRLESLFTHIPGLNVVLPSNPADARALMNEALSLPEATIFFEDRMIPDSTTSPSDLDDGLPKKMPFGVGCLRRIGSKLTIVSYALTLRMLDRLLAEQQLDYELIDLRCLYPVDYTLIAQSVHKTGALLIVEPDIAYSGIGAEIAAQISDRCFSSLRQPVRRIGSPRGVIPASIGLHEKVIPSGQDILRLAKEMSY